MQKTNKYDKNAIRADNQQHQQVGHINRCSHLTTHNPELLLRFLILTLLTLITL
jgi:hypothetical protein